MLSGNRNADIRHDSHFKNIMVLHHGTIPHRFLHVRGSSCSLRHRTGNRQPLPPISVSHVSVELLLSRAHDSRTESVLAAELEVFAISHHAAVYVAVSLLQVSLRCL